MKFIYISLLVLICGCASQKTDSNSNEDYRVLNAYLEENKDSIIFNTSTLALDYKKPKMIFQGYYGFSKRFKKLKTKKAFFNKKQVEELTAKYSDWEIGEWDTLLIKKNKIKFDNNFKNKTFNLTEEERIEEIKIKTSLQKWTYTISKPFYDKNNKKAFLIIKTEIKYNHHAGGLSIAQMKKINGKWKYYGSPPF